MRFRKADVTHITSFKEGSFKSWQEIASEVKDFRLEASEDGINRAAKALALTFE